MIYLKTYELFGFGSKKSKTWQQKFDDIYNFYLKNKNKEDISVIDLPHADVKDNELSISQGLDNHLVFYGDTGKNHNWELVDFSEADYADPKSDNSKRIIDETKDILLELSDNDIRYQINKYIDDMIFELQIDIAHIETKEQKTITEDVIFRLNQFLEEHDLSIQKIEFYQNIDGESHKHDLYDIDEIDNLQDSAGLLTIAMVFGEHSY